MEATIVKKSFLLLGAMSFAIVLSACGNEETTEKTEVDTKNEQVAIEENGDENKQDHTDGQLSIASNDFFETHEGNLEHVHGLGYAGNQNAVFFASHDGLKVYENGIWFKTKELNNDYMGFNAVNKGFYTSGHPGKGVNLPNPLGLKRSFDNGETLEDLALEGESDFHAMGVGYENHIVYVLNGHPNSLMGKGLYVSKNNGETWNELKADQLGEKIFSIAVHPTNEEIVAVAGQEGIFLSKDGGQQFNLITSSKQGTAVFFSNDALWYGAFGQEPVLVKYSIDRGDEEEMDLPNMAEDAVMYVAQNPQNESEIVFISFKGSVYLSGDGASSWKALVIEGEIQ
jgi:hypothetical protein